MLVPELADIGEETGLLKVISLQRGLPIPNSPVAIRDTVTGTLTKDITGDDGSVTFTVPWGRKLLIYPGAIPFFGDPNKPGRKAMANTYPEVPTFYPHRTAFPEIPGPETRPSFWEASERWRGTFH